ncbi:unnamed protein product [Candida verbasci]|uniref:PHD-type domain-containing protein n=1 Tax=Candida verbasci TaxID=1227364 RepID=A0A9W4TXJ7_9ASCO|nr:unnamed protein product [Candida verbasci]
MFDIEEEFRKFQSAPKYNLNSDELFCICRKIDNGEMMIACDGCEEWFHFKCMNIDLNYQNLIQKFYCKFCEWKEVGKTLYKRKCRLHDCYNPISNGSKYCIEEHGKIFMKSQLFRSGDHGLSSTMIKGVLDYIGDDVEKLKQLGASFPELPEVIKYKDTKEADSFPDDVKSELEKTQLQDQEVEKEIKQQEEKLQNLLDMKETIKLLNEKLTLLVYPEQPKKGQKKKVDLCFCHKLNDGENIIKKIYESDDLIQEIPDYEEDCFHSVCIKDRKKCLRHTGWWNLYYDEVIKLLERLKMKRRNLNHQQENILRNYSKKVYENI